MAMADLRYAARRLARSPGFTITAATLLALGIGANAVIFGALDALLLRPLPVRQPEQLVRMVQDRPRLGRRSVLPHRYYQALKEHATTLSAVFGEEPMQVAMGIPAPAEQINISLVTPEYFEVLGVPAAIGRTLTAADANPSSGAPPAVLSYGFWRRRFSGDERAVGRNIELHGHAFSVVGVMPREFNGVSIDTTPDVRVPLATYSLLSVYNPNAALDTIWVDLAGRMKPGVTRERAQAEALAIWRNITKGTDEQDSEPIQMDSLLHGVSVLRQRFTGALRLLIASVALLQLLVCANL